jgi:hypothetical protein
MRRQHGGDLDLDQQAPLGSRPAEGNFRRVLSFSEQQLNRGNPMSDTSRPDSHAPASPEERRALDADELVMADQSRNPQLGRLSDRELSDLISRLRSRRNRARNIADRQGREARAKAAPAGASPAKGNEGTLSKHDYLNAALTRAMGERKARGGSDDDGEGEEGEGSATSQPSQRDLAEKAMRMKQDGESGQNPMMEEGGALHPDDPDASAGKGNLDDTARRTAPSGALDHAGDLPSRERSRTRY